MIFDMPAYIQNYLICVIVCEELFVYPCIFTNWTNSYDPEGNRQYEWYNGIIYLVVILTFRSQCLQVTQQKLI